MIARSSTRAYGQYFSECPCALRIHSPARMYKRANRLLPSSQIFVDPVLAKDLVFDCLHMHLFLGVYP